MVMVMDVDDQVLRRPVRPLPGEQLDEPPAGGRALCLSGGGYRAMLFHVGVLWRLNEAGELPRLDRVSSVSGGSLTAGALAQAWRSLDFTPAGVAANFVAAVVEPVRRLARVDVDAAAVRRGVLSPFSSVGDSVARAYERHLFGSTTLQDLPDTPRFVVNATNVGSGVLARFSKRHLADWRVGCVPAPEVPLSVAVACSSAFPPFLSPYRLDLRGSTWLPGTGTDLTADEHRDEWLLTDGGVYDNLGIETAWKRHRTVLVSDAGGRLAADADPDGDWGRHLVRVLKTVDGQVRSLRKRQVVAAYRDGSRLGAYLGIRTDVRRYGVPDPLPAPVDRTAELAEVPTRLAAVEEPLQERLIDWGYAVCDAGLRSHVDGSLPRGSFPYDVGV